MSNFTLKLPYRRGTILIVVMLIMAALVGMVLVLGRSARVEAMSSMNHLAGARAAAVERAAEQSVIAMLAQQRDTALTLEESYFSAVPVGDAGAYWIVRPDYGDSTMPAYGLVDEASKLNLNSTTADQLRALPSIPDELADAIVDWHDEDSDVTGSGGAEDTYYLALPNAYRCKNDLFESVEELLLVRGAYPALLYGDGVTGTPAAANTGSASGIGGLSESDLLARGLLNYVTVYSKEPPVGGAGRVRTGRINLNTASREVLACLPNITSAEVDSLISKRGTSGFGLTDTAWAVQVLGPKAAQLTNYITGQAYQFSADIVAASGDGRAFKRVRIVVDATDSTTRPKVIYRHEITDRGWPLGEDILAQMRAGTWSGSTTGTTGGTTLSQRR